MQKLAVLSLHTSPLAQAGTGDGGGMNVYVRQLSSALARAGVACDVYTRTDRPDAPEQVAVEPGLVVHHVDAGPRAHVDKGALHRYVEEFTDGVEERMRALEGRGEAPANLLHANYWLSGVVGHTLKHRLGLPLVSTFHTLDRVKAESSPEDFDPSDPGRRSRAEAEVIGCSDSVLASCSVEVDQLVELYGADPSRVVVLAPGVERAIFSPGDRAQARRAIEVEADGPLLLFVGRIQPLKAADVAVRVLAALSPDVVGGPAGRGAARRALSPSPRLAVVGGPSGSRGEEELLALHALVDALGIEGQVAFRPPQAHHLLSSYYRAADCCIVPSRSESFGLVALEAAACGTPVVASSVGGLTTLVEHGSTGFLVDPGDVTGFAGRVAEILDDRRLAATMAAAAAERASVYTWPMAADRLKHLCTELTERPLVEC